MHTPFQSDIAHSCCCCRTGESRCSLSYSHHFINNNLVKSRRQIVSLTLTLSLNWASQVRALLARISAASAECEHHRRHRANNNAHSLCLCGHWQCVGIVLNVGCRHHKHFLQITGAHRSAAASAAAAGDNPASKQTTTEWSILMECECSPCKVILLVRRKDGWMDENLANRQTSSLTHSLTHSDIHGTQSSSSSRRKQKKCGERCSRGTRQIEQKRGKKAEKEAASSAADLQMANLFQICSACC